MSLPAGTELDDGKYRIVRLIDRGGMGAVYEAEHTRSGKRFAIKCMEPARRSCAQDVDARGSAREQENDADMERLVREARASARVRHRNVVEVFDLRREGSKLYLVMEYLEGETLRALLNRRELPAHRLIALVLPAMQAVAAAHKQGVIHRDIKPENIFLARELDAPEPIIKVLDFGISKLLEEEHSALTVTGALQGTPAYMPYEQLCGQRDIDGRADVYAFGVLLYEALSGQLPYQANTLPELCSLVIQSAPAPLAQLCPELPDSLSRLVMWALRKERDARLPSMKRLISELEPFSTARGMQAELAMASEEHVPPEELAASSPAFQSAQPSAPRLVNAVASAPSAFAQPLAPKVGRRWLVAAALLGLAIAVPLAVRREAEPTRPALQQQVEALGPTQPPPGAPSVPASTPASLHGGAAPVPAPDTESATVIKRVRAKPAAKHSATGANLADAGSAAEAPSPALAAARAHHAAELERLTKQLIACDELASPEIRAKCRNDHKRAIAEFEEQRALVESAYHP